MVTVPKQRKAIWIPNDPVLDILDVIPTPVCPVFEWHPKIHAKFSYQTFWMLFESWTAKCFPFLG